MNVEQQLRATSDSVLATLDQLALLETEKRTLKPDSQRFQDVALEIERLAADMFAQAHAQERLGERSQAEAARGKNLPPIDKVPATRELHVILEEWRAAERQLAAASPRTADHARAAAEISRVREEYQRTFALQTKLRPQPGS